MRNILLLVGLMAVLGWGARADAQERRPIHLALEVPLLSWAKASPDEGRWSDGETTNWQVVAPSALGLRGGYLTSLGLELGAATTFGFRSVEVESTSVNYVQATVFGYLRYLFLSASTRPFVGILGGGDFARAYGGEDVLNYQRGGMIGAEAGLHLQITEWLSLDPFARYECVFGTQNVNIARGPIEALFEGDDFVEVSWGMRTHRILVGLALSSWL